MLDYDKLRAPLSINDIDFRIQSINKGGYATVLAYKNARVDMHRLDSIVHPENWQRKHEFKNGHLYCSVGIYDKEKEQWVWKEDVGTESNAEAEKGQASDSFKRACFNWGIGRELYAYPRISIQLFQNDKKDNYGEWFIDTGRSGKPKKGWGLKLDEWTWYTEFNEEGVLTFIGVKDQKNVMRFSWGEMRPREPKVFKLNKKEFEEEENILKTLTTVNQINNSYLKMEQRAGTHQLDKSIKDLYQFYTEELKNATQKD